MKVYGCVNNTNINTFSEIKIDPDMTLKQQLTTLEIQLDNEESGVAGHCNDILAVKEILLKLKTTPLLSILQLKHDDLDFICSMDESSLNTKVL